MLTFHEWLLQEVFSKKDAKKVLIGQPKRKQAHARRIANKLDSYGFPMDVVAAGFLHDQLERDPTGNIDNIIERMYQRGYKITNRTIWLIKQMTRESKKTSTIEHVQKVLQQTEDDPTAKLAYVLLKIHDRRDNVYKKIVEIQSKFLKRKGRKNQAKKLADKINQPQYQNIKPLKGVGTQSYFRNSSQLLQLLLNELQKLIGNSILYQQILNDIQNLEKAVYKTSLIPTGPEPLDTTTPTNYNAPTLP